jgi:hypothetical protein
LNLAVVINNEDFGKVVAISDIAHQAKAEIDTVIITISKVVELLCLS